MGILRQGASADDTLRLEIGYYSSAVEPLRALGRTKEAQERLNQSATMLRQLMSETPGTLVLQTELASTKKAIGDLRHDTGQSQKASESYQRSLDLLEPLAHAPPENLRLQWHLAAVYDSLARHERHPKWCDKRSHNWLRMTPNSTYRRQRLQQAEAQ